MRNYSNCKHNFLFDFLSDQTQFIVDKPHPDMPSTRKQKAREKRARQSDVMSDVENLDVRLAIYTRNELGEQGDNSEKEMETTVQEVPGKFRFYWRKH